MLFNALTYAIFLPLVFALYWFVLRRELKLQNLLILISSYVFYGWWDWRFLTLIFISTLVDFIAGWQISQSEEQSKRKLWVTISVVFNLSLLGFFKYYNFFVDSFIDLFAQFSIVLHRPTLAIILPVGISFYTFQTMSYTIDIYRRKMEPTSDIIAFFAFVSFFPQLVAGPIERASNLLPQFYTARRFDAEQAKEGLKLILWGLIKKVVIADTIGLYINQLYAGNDFTHQPGLILFYGLVLFNFQVYGDFSGYSDIATGSARLLGFRLMTNFNYPFFSRNYAELWQRWHISLTSWFRDYLYFPLGGSRGSRWKQTRNILITYTVSGLWHGANWSFFIWGAAHAVFYVPVIWMKNRPKYNEIVAANRYLPSIGDFLRILLTNFLFALPVALFRAVDLKAAMSYYKHTIANFSLELTPLFDILQTESFWLVVVLMLVEWLQRTRTYPLDLKHLPAWARWILYAAALAAFMYLGQFESNKQFIYFQF